MFEKLSKRITRVKRQISDALHPATIKAVCSYHLAKKKAEALSRQTDSRVYVLCDDDGKLVVTDRTSFFRLCRMHKIPKKITIKNLHVNSLYYTSGIYYKGAKLCHYKTMPKLIQKRKLQHYKRFMRSL